MCGRVRRAGERGGERSAYAAPAGAPTCGGGRRHALPRAEQPDAARGEVEIRVEKLQQLLRHRASEGGSVREAEGAGTAASVRSAEWQHSWRRAGAGPNRAHHAEHALHWIVLRVHVLLQLARHRPEKTSFTFQSRKRQRRSAQCGDDVAVRPHACTCALCGSRQSMHQQDVGAMHSQRSTAQAEQGRACLHEICDHRVQGRQLHALGAHQRRICREGPPGRGLATQAGASGPLAGRPGWWAARAGGSP